MRRNFLIGLLLFSICLTLAVWIERWRFGMSNEASRSDSVLALMFGEGRTLIANSLMAKADAYFHRGNYPSIFEAQRKEENHMTATAKEDAGENASKTGSAHEHSHDEHSHSHAEDHDHDHDHEDPAPVGDDWIERFGKRFRASDHVHLEDGEEREMLPWLQLSAELDRQNIESYTVGAYWLRKRLGKPDEAERFLRKGLRSNPQSPDLLNELGWLYLEEKNDPTRARNVLRAAWQRWLELEQPKEKPDTTLAARILWGLVQLETKERRWAEVLTHLELLKNFSPNPEAVQKRIESVRENEAKNSSK